MLVIGTSWTGTPAQTSFQSDRVTSPCNLLTPFACRLRRRARIVMLNGSSGLRRVWPNENSSSNGMFSSFAKLPKYFCIISRGNGSMRSENIGRRYDLKCRIKIELLFHDIETNALERQERRMPFVHVKHVRLNSERSERFHSANPEHDLLTHAHLKVAAVKLGSNQSILGFVFRNIGIEEVDVYPSDAQFPNPGKNVPVQNPHRDNKLRLAPANFSDRQVIEVLIEVNRLLNAILIDLLPEIAVSIKKTDRNEIQIKIAGRLAVVARQDAQTTGVIRDRFVKTEFSGKIGNGIFDRAAGSGFSIGILSSEILLEVLKNLLELAHKIFVLRQLFQPGLPRKL